MRLPRVTISAGMLALSWCGVALADSGPAIVVPGRPGVPVIVNGIDVSGAVVYGDWGLARPCHGEIVIDGPGAYAGPGVPVIVEGMDVSGAVVCGDWGLARPGDGESVRDGPVAYAAPWMTGGYY